MTDSASGTNEPASLADIEQIQKRINDMWTAIDIVARVGAEGSADDEQRLARVESEAADAQGRVAWLWVVLIGFFIYEIVKLVILFV